jgi:hypothetical protein
MVCGMGQTAYCISARIARGSKTTDIGLNSAIYDVTLLQIIMETP